MKPQTFSDETKQVYTVTNAPPIIPKFATSIDANTLASSSLGTLLRPQLNIGSYPELPFLLRRLPVGDPLLSRVGVDPTTLTLARHEGGWALPDEIRNAWNILVLLASEVYYTNHRTIRSPPRSIDLMKDNLSAPSVTMTVGKIDDEVASAGSVAD